jgi:hypothetical protein
VTVWKALRTAGISPPLIGWGRLLAQTDQPAVRGAA